VERSILRKQAYKYIVERLSHLPAINGSKDSLHNISLEDLKLLKEGEADPSLALVNIIKHLLAGSVTETEINTYLVNPFEK
jgi:hypothetical protein